MAQYEICIVSAGDRAVAKKITEALVSEQLAACVSAIEGMKSMFRWKGKMEEADEILLLIKTRASLREEVMQCIKNNHNYEVPEILFIPIEGSREYLDWIGANTRFSMADAGKKEGGACIEEGEKTKD